MKETPKNAGHTHLIVPNQRHILDVLNKKPKSLKCWELLYTVILSTTETFAQPPSTTSPWK